VLLKVSYVLNNRVQVHFPLKLKVQQLNCSRPLILHLFKCPDLLKDLRKYASRYWEDLRVYINDRAYSRFSKTELVKGVDQGLVNPRIKCERDGDALCCSVQSSLENPEIPYHSYQRHYQTDEIKSFTRIYDQADHYNAYNGILTEES